MVNAVRRKNGKYRVDGKSYQMLVGSRVQVWNGTAKKTGYGKKGLTRADLVKNKWGRIVSRKKHVRGKKTGLKRLHAKGWFVSKGKFGAKQRKGRKSRKATGKSRRKTRRCRHKSGPKKGKYKKC